MNFLNSFSNFGKNFFAKAVLRITQLGADIDGEAASDYSGSSVSMNSAGNRVAIGAPYNDGTSGTDRGHVRIYEWNGTIWTQLGVDIDGEASSDLSGYSVSMNAVGDRVAIGAIWNDGTSGTDRGHVRVYQWNGTIWTQLGVDIDGEASDDRSGYSVSINAAGDRVAIGATLNDANTGVVDNRGHVRIYEWNGTSWTQMGSDIDGEVADDQFGYSVSMNAAGDRVVIGSYRNNGIAGNDSGHFRAYSWNGTGWIQMGTDVEGKTAYENFGYSVSMNSAGDRVVAGAPGYSDTLISRGSVRIYQWNGTIWTQLGGDILGQPIFASGNDFSGSSVSINAAGDRVAISAPYNDAVESGSSLDNRGKVSIYEWNGTAWIQLGIDIIGEAAGDRSGSSVSINSTGDTVAITAPYNDGISGTDRGHVRVYKLT